MVLTGHSCGAVASCWSCMTTKTLLAIACGVILSAGCDPDCLRVRFTYNGRRTGRVYATLTGTPTNGAPQFATGLFADGLSLEQMRSWNGDPCPVTLGGLRSPWFRSSLENGGRITAWIDMDGDDAERCRRPLAIENPASGAVSTCFPEPGDPMGITPLPPFEAVIPLVVRDPGDPGGPPAP
jgi:hypothetical protein